MLKVGLTGGVGSGKSAVARVWEEEGVPILEADALGRALMQPGEQVFAEIVRAFGPAVVHSDGTLDRAALADQAFTNKRLDELNAIVHPAVIAAQEKGLRQLAAAGHLLAVVESALIFEVSGEVSREVSRNAPDDAPSGAPDNAPGDLPAGGSVPGWRNRFDRIVLVAAPEAVRVERYVARVLAHGGPAQGTDELRADTLREDARRRMAAQLPDGWKRRHSDYVIENDRTLVLLRREALRVLKALRGEANARSLPATTF